MSDYEKAYINISSSYYEATRILMENPGSQAFLESPGSFTGRFH